jgi:hypothetical protein
MIEQGRASDRENAARVLRTDSLETAPSSAAPSGRISPVTASTRYAIPAPLLSKMPKY